MRQTKEDRRYEYFAALIVIMLVCLIVAAPVFTHRAAAAGIEIRNKPQGALSQSAVIAVTNNQVLTITDRVMLFDPSGGSVTNTIANASAAGLSALLVNTNTTFDMIVLNAGTWKSGELTLAGEGTAEITAVATNRWYGK